MILVLEKNLKQLSKLNKYFNILEKIIFLERIEQNCV